MKRNTKNKMPDPVAGTKSMFGSNGEKKSRWMLLKSDGKEQNYSILL